MLAASFAALAANDVYKWKDANGQWHYGDKPPADQQAEIVPIAPPPTIDASAPVATPDAGATPDKPRKGRKPKPKPEPEVFPGLWSEITDKQAQESKPRTVREVQRGCAALVNACTGTGKADTAQCLSEVRPCAADPTMEKQECCPAACSMRYAELRSQGLPEGLSFSRAVFSSPSCVPGADEAGAIPNAR